MTSVNWADLIKDAGEIQSYEPLPDGDYDLVVVEGTAKVSQSGKQMFSIKAQVEAGQYAKRLVWDNLVVSEGNATALGIFFSKMAAMGLNQDYFNQNPSPAQIEQALTGRKFRGKLGTKTYNGKESNEIKSYYPAAASIAAGGVPPQAAPAPAPAPAAAPAPQAAPAPAPAPQAAPAPVAEAENPWAATAAPAAPPAAPASPF